MPHQDPPGIADSALRPDESVAVGERIHALRRRWVAQCAAVLMGPGTDPPSFFLARRLYLRLLGVVHLVAFVSLWVQIEGLIGSDGVLPVEKLLGYAADKWGPAERLWRLPTLCWLNSSDVLLNGLCAAGSLLAALLIVGVAPWVVLVLLWVLYLSLTVAGQAFLSFQWDVLLLEATFLALFLAPKSMLPGRPDARPPSRAGIWLQWLLLFKLMFLSGATKLLSGDPTWRDLTAMNYHYMTQPIPTWISWYAYHLPQWMHKASVVGTLVIELAVPFLIFGPRRLRYAACLLLAGLQVMIAATGNYGFFNLLSIVLCVLLMDDSLLRRVYPKRWAAWLDSETPPAPRQGPRRIAVVAAAGLVALTSVLATVREMVRTGQPDKLYGPVVYLLDTLDLGLLSWGQPLVLDPIASFRTINGYGLFRVMTTQRPEIVIEASRDGYDWQAYEFKWKPGDPARPPRFVAPHQPRLDWQMWFAALNPNAHAYWLQSLIDRLLEGSPDVLALLDKNPFPDKPPRYMRLMYYRYEFTSSDVATPADPDAWWRRTRLGPITRPIVRQR